MSVVTRIRTSEEISVSVPPEAVWDVLTRPGAYREWWPMRWPVRMLQKKPDLLGTEFEVRSRVGGSFCLRIEELHPPLAMRFRFFGGVYEGPGGFLLEPRGDVTRVRFDIDVFARGMTTAILSQFVPLDMLQRFHIRRLLRQLSRRVLTLQRRAAKAQQEAARAAARVRAEELARRVAAEAEAKRLAEEARREAEEEEARAAAATAARLAAEAESRRIAEEETARVRAAEEGEAPRLSAEQSGARPTAPPEGVLKAALRRIANWLASSRSAPEASPSQTARPESKMAGFGDEKFHNARLFLEALSSPSLPGEIRRFLGSEHLREEYAHRFLDRARSSNLDETLRIRAEDLETFANQRFEIRDVASGGSQVAIELEWSAAVAADHPPFAKGQELAARVAIFFKFEDGRIVRQRIYTCFEPWSDAVERAAVQAARAARPQTASSPRPEVRPRPAGSNFEIARSYFAALSARAEADEIAAFFAEDAVQEELPNRLSPLGDVRTLADIRRARENALEHFASEEFELRGATGSGALVALETRWSACVARTRGPFTAGQRLEAHIAVFLEFRDGLILRQRNYGCFNPSDTVTS